MVRQKIEDFRRASPDRTEVAAHIVEHHRHLVLGKLLDQPEQLLALRAHELSVRRAWLITSSLRHARSGGEPGEV
jgi:hypothetical protein